jgi:tRNA (guanine37-N1)-methyltransferase
MANLKELLGKKLKKEELNLVPSSFEIVGSREKAVAIVEIKLELRKKEKLIADAIIKMNKNIKSVLKKVSGREGKYRIKKYKLIAGSRNTEVVHREHRCLFKLDPRKVYFSSREGTERERISKLVKNDEKILVMFSGISPYSIVISKKSKASKIYSIEINPAAHRYALENIKLNKVKHKVITLKGDVRKICLKLKEKFDRIVMPLPRTGYNYLELAVKCLKKNGIIHFYYYGDKSKLYDGGEKIIKEVSKKLKRKSRILNKKIVLPYGPNRFKVVFDVKFY